MWSEKERAREEAKERIRRPSCRGCIGMERDENTPAFYEGAARKVSNILPVKILSCQ